MTVPQSIKVNCNVYDTKPVDLEEGELPVNVGKMSVEAEQIGDKVVKVSFIEYVGRRKKVTRIEVKESELDQMIKESDGPITLQLAMF